MPKIPRLARESRKRNSACVGVIARPVLVTTRRRQARMASVRRNQNCAAERQEQQSGALKIQAGNRCRNVRSEAGNSKVAECPASSAICSSCRLRRRSPGAGGGPQLPRSCVSVVRDSGRRRGWMASAPVALPVRYLACSSRKIGMPAVCSLLLPSSAFSCLCLSSSFFGRELSRRFVLYAQHDALAGSVLPFLHLPLDAPLLVRGHRRKSCDDSQPFFLAI